MWFKSRVKSLLPKSHYQSLNTIEINQDHILHNFSELQKLQPHHTIIPVVKSNAYGHGLKQICTILNTIPNNQLPLIAVDSYPEYQIVADTTNKTVLVLGETLSSNYHLYNSHRTHIAVGSLEVLESLIATKKKWNIHLFLNTGMNREGFQKRELQQAFQLLSQHNHITIAGIMSHLANADMSDNTFTQQQVKTFKDMSNSIIQHWHHPLYIHISNSAGISKIHNPLFTASRTGLAMYGYNPLDSWDPCYKQYATLKPALRLISTITAIQHLKPWDGVNYGLSWTTDQETTLATLPIGYNEWLPRWSWNWYHVYSHNHKFPLRGKVCMNLSSIEIKDYPSSIGEKIEIIWWNKNKKNTIQALATINTTIPYTILTRLNSKLKRVII